MNKIKIVLVMTALLFLAGCASTNGGAWTDDRWKCALAGGAAGGAIGSLDDGDAALAGAAVGAALGAIFCGGSDSDGDGVKDSRDQCPGTPPGAPVDENGCELDADGDGVVDSEDRCPNTPAGAPVDARGCELDSDGDGVLDSKDQCPGTPSVTPVDNNGCELPEAYVLYGIRFEFDSAKLTDDSRAVLDGALEILQRHPDVKVEIAGHTDSLGSKQYNQALSERRAGAVLEYMTSHGANGESLSATGYGESQPVADNDSEQGRELNRRVEFRH